MTTEQDFEQGGLVPVTVNKRRILQKINQWNSEAWTLNAKIMDARLALGELAGTSCLVCRKTIPWSGHGKPSRYCDSCNKERRKEYKKKWNSENAEHIRDYLRRRRGGLPPHLRRYKLRKGRGLPPDDHEYEALHGEGTAHYPHERDQVRE